MVGFATTFNTGQSLLPAGTVFSDDLSHLETADLGQNETSYHYTPGSVRVVESVNVYGIKDAGPHSFYAAIGAAVDNQTDSQQFLLPIIMPLMLSVYIGFFTVINDPHGTVAIVFSMIPLTSPIVMLMRIPFGVPLWQIAISVTLLFASFFSVVWFSAKIYRIGILMYGKKPTWGELYKWIKY